MDASDAAVVLARAREGDGDAFRLLVERHSHAAFRLAFRMTGNEQDAEDIVQESFLRAYRQLDRFESRSHFGTWLHRIVANCSMDFLRARQSRRDQRNAEPLDAVVDVVATTAPGPERSARDAEIRERVEASMATLSPLERAAFTLRHYEGRSIDEIGDMLGLRTSAAKHSVFRAVRKLRLALQALRGGNVNGKQGGHYDEEALILHYYGESTSAGDIDAHIGQCDACAASYRELCATLGMVAAPAVPERGEHYGLEVWQRIRTRLPERRSSWATSWATLWAALWGTSGTGLRVQVAVVAAVLVIGGFAAGRSWREPMTVSAPSPVTTNAAAPDRGVVPTETGAKARRRVLLLSVAEHFEESDRALTEFLNAADGRNLESEREWADELLSTSRLYRRDAIDADETSVAAMLDDLERALLEIVHTPSLATREQLDELDRRIDSAALLFKVRMMSDDLRRRERPAPAVDRASEPGTTKAS